MRNFIFSILSLCLFSSFSAHALEHSGHHHHPKEHEHHHYLNFEVHRQDYTFSSIFDCLGEHDFLGTIVKGSFHLRTHYDLYGVHGNYEGTGICRALTLGTFFDWAREIDIYGPEGEYVGMIDGQFATEAKAKYSIYNANGTRVGIAYLDHASSSFTISNPQNENHYIAYLKRHFVHNAVDHWNVTIYDEDEIDLRIIKVFATFAVDSQNSFRADQ